MKRSPFAIVSKHLDRFYVFLQKMAVVHQSLEHCQRTVNWLREQNSRIWECTPELTSPGVDDSFTLSFDDGLNPTYVINEVHIESWSVWISTTQTSGCQSGHVVLAVLHAGQRISPITLEMLNRFAVRYWGVGWLQQVTYSRYTHLFQVHLPHTENCPCLRRRNCPVLCFSAWTDNSCWKGRVLRPPWWCFGSFHQTDLFPTLQPYTWNKPFTCSLRQVSYWSNGYRTTRTHLIPVNIIVKSGRQIEFIWGYGLVRVDTELSSVITDRSFLSVLLSNWGWLFTLLTLTSRYLTGSVSCMMSQSPRRTLSPEVALPMI